MSAVTRMRSAVMVPSSSTAASRSVTWARPCVVAIMCSTRVSVERGAAQTLAHHALLYDALGFDEDTVGVPGLDRVLVLDVAGCVVVDLRRALGHRSERIRHGGQRLPVDDDIGGGVHRDLLRRRDDGGDGLADVAHTVH